VGSPLRPQDLPGDAGRAGFERVLACRLVEGKVTYVHRRLWPALVRAAKRFPRTRLAQVTEIHAASGKHVTCELAFPKWVPKKVVAAAAAIDEEEALANLGDGVLSGAVEPHGAGVRVQQSRGRSPVSGASLKR
jgi:hypothetical protein